MQNYHDEFRPDPKIQEFLETYNVDFITYSIGISYKNKIKKEVLILMLGIFLFLFYLIGYQELANFFQEFSLQILGVLSLKQSVGEIDWRIFIIGMFVFLRLFAFVIELFQKPKPYKWYAVCKEGFLFFDKFYRINLIEWKFFPKDCKLEGNTLSFKMSTQHLKNCFGHLKLDDFSIPFLKQKTVTIEEFVFNDVVMADQLYNKIHDYVSKAV